jgi:hypothetical protein
MQPMYSSKRQQLIPQHTSFKQSPFPAETMSAEAQARLSAGLPIDGSGRLIQPRATLKFATRQGHVMSTSKILNTTSC